MAHTIAEVIIKRALSRQVIRKESIGQISETYKIITKTITANQAMQPTGKAAG